MKTENSYHQPVLKEEVCDLLITDKSGCYLDCTLGGGGHFRALAEKLSANAVLIGIDRDIDAINWNKKAMTSYSPSIVIEQSRFSRFDEVLEKHNITGLNGALLDLGVSSFQIDTASRGFSYMKDSVLDMRMNPSEGISASEFLEQSSEEQLCSILSEYGEVHNAARMAKAIKSCKELKTSSDLRRCLAEEYGPNLQIKVIAKVFQALRIAVNDELGELKKFLSKITGYLLKGGRLAVIAYHSLEDRMVKDFIREQERGCVCPVELPFCVCGKQMMLKRITRKAIRASIAEVKNNPRSRSARLRVAERTEVINEKKK
jgi:16S rRNA (cytosine1402-N4)-methyltransferase